MANYRKLNLIFGWLAFAVAAFTYLSTIEPTASFWDCGEYIACSHKLEVGHPPGAPLFILLGRLFIIFGGDNPATAAKCVNIMSALASAFTILFLFWSITALAKKIATLNGAELTAGKIYAIMGSGLVGALAYTFSDSFWFSAVEGEVYATSSMFTAIVFWAILRWEADEDEAHRDRWLILIFYLLGLSIGVHLLGLLVLPSIVFIYYFKNYQPTRNGIIIALLISLVVLGGILNGIIPGIVNVAASYEIFFINKLGLPFNMGTIIYFLLLLGFIITGIRYTNNSSDTNFNIFLVLGSIFFLFALISGLTLGNAGDTVARLLLAIISLGGIVYLKKRQDILKKILLCFSVLLIGYSSFFILIIRSQANPPMDENNPENAVNLLSYLKREQYGDWPLFFGQYYNSPLDNEKPYADANPIYGRDDKSKKYIILDERKAEIPNYDKEFCTVFPRMYSQQDNHSRGYKSWAEVTGTKIPHYNRFRDKEETIEKPTWWENFKFFWKYQMGHMYFRYFMWNFAGRQNDIQGNGVEWSSKIEGNWISGIPFIDGSLPRSGAGVLGSQDKLPESVTKNKGNNKLYCLPLLLGLLGLYYHWQKQKKDTWVVLLLFLCTGIAIGIYLNMPPFQPRERDYAFVGSFYAFAIWIGLGVMALYDYLKMKNVVQAVGATALCTLAVPVLMAGQEWNDHNRARRYTCVDFARNYLESCAPNAILFTNGDNDTFPLWYAQEVEGIRTDVRVINLSLANTDWYIEQMRRQAYDSEPVKFNLDQSKYVAGNHDFVPILPNPKLKDKHIDLKELMSFVGREDQDALTEWGANQFVNFLPTKNIRIGVDTAKVLKNGTVSRTDVEMPGKIMDAKDSMEIAMGKKKLKPQLATEIDFSLKGTYIIKNTLMVLDLISANEWDRPIYFAVTAGPENYYNMQSYFQLEGLAYRLVPVKNPNGQPRVNTEVMYNNIMKKFKWGNLDKEELYMDENNMRMALTMRMQMITLADALNKEGKKDKALNVLNKAMEALPERNVPLYYDPIDYTYFLFTSFADAGGKDQESRLAKRLFEILAGDLDYYLSLKGSQQSSFRSEMNRKAGMMGAVLQQLDESGLKDLKKELEPKYKKYEHLAAKQQNEQGGPGEE